MGIGRYKVQSLLKEKRLFKLCRDLYVDDLSPYEVAQAITSYFSAILTGRSAAQLHLNLTLTFPIHAEGSRRIDAETFTITRSRLPSRTEIEGLPVVEALWAARAAPKFAQHILEHHYAGNDGNERLAADLSRMSKVPAWLRDLIKQTPTASRSELERQVARPLLQRGYHVQMNRFVGPYCFDILLPQWKIAIEVDSAMYHHNGKSFISDRWKGNSGAVHGWIVLRFTDTCVEYLLDSVLQEIEQAITWVKAGRPHRNYQPGFPASLKAWEWNPIFGRN